MPLGGLLPYDEEERRKRLLTPGINPNAPLPPVPAPRPIPVPRGGIPGGAPTGPIPGAPRPSTLPELDPLPPEAERALLSSAAPIPNTPIAPINRPSRYEELSEAKDVYLQGTPGRGRSAGLGALRGVGPGLQAGGLAGGLGGLVAGALGGLINPRRLREMEFDERVKPEIFERFGMEDAERALQAQAAKQTADAAMNRMQMANMQSQIDSRAASDALAQDQFNLKMNEPLVVSPGQNVLTRGPEGEYAPVFTAPGRPRPADDAAAIEAALTDELGTIEEETQRSLEGRREMLKKHLTPDELRIINGQITRDDSPETITRAQAKWAKIQSDEEGRIRRDTGERRRTKVSQKRFGTKQGAASSSAYTRNVNNLPPLR